MKKDAEQVLITSEVQDQTESSNQVDRLPEFDEYGTALNDI